LLLASLAACAGPVVETTPVAPITPPPTWRTDAGPTAPFDRTWWQGFGDPALTALVEQALASNIDIAIAAARIREAKAQQGIARAALLPTIDATGGVTDSRTVNAFGEPIEQTAGQPQVQAAWEADLFGRLSDRASAARSAWLASQAARDAIRLSVAGTAASGYITLLALDARLAVAKQTLDARAAALKLAQLRSDAGYSPRLELAQAQADMRRADALVADGSISERERDQTRAARLAAQATVQQASATRQIGTQDVRSVLVGRSGLEAAVEGARAQLHLAQIDLDNSIIRAPVAGQLSEIGVRNGAYVTAGTQLMFLVPHDHWVIANYKEAQTHRMRVGQRATFRVDALGGAKLTGHVENMAPAAGSEFAVLKADNATGNFVKVAQRIAVRVRIDPGQDLAKRLRPGMSVVIKIHTHD
jgi:multidrug resistance efflux pump